MFDIMHFVVVYVKAIDVIIKLLIKWLLLPVVAF